MVSSSFAGAFALFVCSLSNVEGFAPSFGIRQSMKVCETETETDSLSFVVERRREPSSHSFRIPLYIY